MTDDIVERLRSITHSNYLKPHDKVCIHKSADEIERLKEDVRESRDKTDETRTILRYANQENKRMKAVVDAADELGPFPTYRIKNGNQVEMVGLAMLQKALAALEGK